MALPEESKNLLFDIIVSDSGERNKGMQQIDVEQLYQNKILLYVSMRISRSPYTFSNTGQTSTNLWVRGDGNATGDGTGRGNDESASKPFYPFLNNDLP